MLKGRKKKNHGDFCPCDNCDNLLKTLAECRI